jgi:hypothetical protein
MKAPFKGVNVTEISLSYTGKYLGWSGWIILNFILEKSDVKVLTGLNWIGLACRGEFSYTNGNQRVGPIEAYFLNS